MIAFEVSGTPAPQGSKKAFLHPITKRILMMESSAKVKPWRQAVADTAASFMRAEGLEPFAGPVEMAVTYFLRPPQKHYRKDGSLRPGSPYLVSNKPDLSKLQRSTEDALTGICYNDDSQIVRMILDKVYSRHERARIAIRPAVLSPHAYVRPAYESLIVLYGASDEPIAE